MPNPFVDAMHTNDTFTENAMPTHSTSGEGVVDLFFKMGAARNLDAEEILRLFVGAFGEDALLATKAAFYNRDVRGGQGERRSFRIMFEYLCEQHPEIARKNLSNVPKYGRWDDVFVAFGTEVESDAIDMIKAALKHGDKLCAKWMPREGKSQDHIAKFLAERMELSMKEYRLLLAGNTEVVENLMCARMWDKIDYSKVPSIASKNYRNAFRRHDEERYTKWLEAVEAGDSKINAAAIFPHDIVRAAWRSSGTEARTMQAQWDALPDYMPKDRKILPVCDVSGSMIGLPLEVCVSLGIYLSERNEGVFKDAFITFSRSPKLQYIRSKDLQGKIREVDQADWGMNTDLEAVFKLVLEHAKVAGLDESYMPDTLLILSDMQFDRCIDKPSDNAMQMIERMYNEAGYDLPTVVFWNLRASTGSPVKFDKQGTALVSGFSPSIMKNLLAGKSITPLAVVQETLNSDRYDSVVV